MYTYVRVLLALLDCCCFQGAVSFFIFEFLFIFVYFCNPLTERTVFSNTLCKLLTKKMNDCRVFEISFCCFIHFHGNRTSLEDNIIYFILDFCTQFLILHFKQMILWFSVSFVLVVTVVPGTDLTACYPYEINFLTLGVVVR